MTNLIGFLPCATHFFEIASSDLSGSLTTDGTGFLRVRPPGLTTVYVVVMDAARVEGVGHDELPDFLDLDRTRDPRLLGQDELDGEDIEAAVEARLRGLAGRMGDTPLQITERLLVAAARVGQHRFAADVLSNFAHRCGFCGLHPGRELERKGLLVRERDPHNRRLYRLRLTDRGRTLHAHMAATFHDQYLRWVAAMTHDERNALLTGLPALVRVVRHTHASATDPH